MSEILFVVGGVSFGILLAAGIVKVSDAWIRRHRQTWAEPTEHEVANLAVFCSDCGQRLVLLSAQSGWDSMTGKPVYDHRMRCPDWDQARYDSKMSHYAKYGLVYAGPSRVFCDKPRKVKGGSVHNHTESMSLDCAPCVADMFQNGALGENEARRLLVKAGVK